MIRINLLPVRQTRKLEAARLELGLAVAGGVLVMVVSLAAWGAASIRFSSVQDENRLLQAEIERLAADVAKVDEMEKFKAELQRKLDVIDQLRRKKNGPVRMLDEIALATPEKLFLTSVEEEDETLRITGVSVSNDVISQFLRSLDASEYFDQVFLLDIEALPPEKNLSVTLKKFQLTARLVSPPDAVAAAAAPTGATTGAGGAQTDPATPATTPGTPSPAAGTPDAATTPGATPAAAPTGAPAAEGAATPAGADAAAPAPAGTPEPPAPGASPAPAGGGK